MTTNLSTEGDQKSDSEVFAEAIINAEFMSPLYTKLVHHFADEMYKAIKGRICVPERMAILYPIFREINIETDESRAYWADFERKDRKKEERRKAKKS